MSEDVTELTTEQSSFAIRQMGRWLEIRGKHPHSSPINSMVKDGLTPGHVYSQMNADVWHSSLLYRLLRGREPLPEPPSLQHSYPVYPDWPY